jgi:hypothetical protein
MYCASDSWRNRQVVLTNCIQINGLGAIWRATCQRFVKSLRQCEITVGFWGQPFTRSIQIASSVTPGDGIEWADEALRGAHGLGISC